MNNKLCITTGYKYTDIDALACVIALAELKDCIAVLPGPFNATIPPCIRNLDFKFRAEFPETIEEFIMVDISEPEFFPKQVPLDKIIKVYDHRAGFEEYWGTRGHIEPVGACATLIFELFQEQGRTPSPVTAQLLQTAIYANTLCFCSEVVTQRDMTASQILQNILSHGFQPTYYKEIEASIISDPEAAVKNDTKILGNGWAIAQLEVENAKIILDHPKFIKALEHCMSGYENWLLTMPSISERQNYFITNSGKIKNALSEKTDVEWNERFGVTDSKHLLLRKEILKLIGVK